jgi:hypothetical protein
MFYKLNSGDVICIFVRYHLWFRYMVFNVTLNNISIISWRSVLLVGKKEYTKKTTDMSQITDKRYHMHNVVSSTPRNERGSNSQL